MLPAGRRQRLAAAAGVGPAEPAVAVAVDRGLDDLAVAAIEAGADPARVLVHVEHNLAVDGAERLQPAPLAALTRLEVDGQLTATQAKAVLAELVAAGGDGDPAAIAAAKGFEAMGDDALASAVDEAIAANGPMWERYFGGEDKVIGALVGAVMKATKGKADGEAVTALLHERRAAAG